MANINAPKIEYFESFANEITSKFRRLQSIVGHPTSSGDYHEEILRTVLRNFLSKRFSVKKGFIYAGPEQVSKQIDLMVIDENSPAAYIFQEGDFAVVIPQAVVAIMEIKTTLHAPDFDQSLENVASAKKLMEFPVNLTGIVFGFDGNNPTDNILEKWFKRETPSKFKDNEVVAPNAVMFLSAKTLLIRCNEQGQIALDGKYYHRIRTDDEGQLHGADFQLSVILAMIINACEQKEFTHTRYFADRQGFGLVQLERGGIGTDRFRFGEGKSQLAQK